MPAGPPAIPGLLPQANILPCLTLVSATPERLEAPIGATIELDLLWQVHCVPAQPVSLRYTLRDTDDNEIITTTALDIQADPDGWQPGQQLRTLTRLRLPSTATPGRYTLLAQGIDPQSGSDLARRLGPFPVPDAQEIADVVIASRDYVTELPTLARAVDVSFGPALKLAAATGLAPELAAGQPLTITLAWQALAPVDASYSVFLHLLGSDGTIAAQRDTIPQAGALPTNLWLPGEVVVDTYTLLPEQSLAPGTYTLIAGLYDPRTMERLPVTTNAGTSMGDHVELGRLTVAR
jgi:hypothetical protein